MTIDEAKQLLEIAKATGNNTLFKTVTAWMSNPLFSFVPRVDTPGDQQTSFLEDRFPGLAVCLAGNAAGKSEAGAVKFANFVLNTPPPRRNTSAWVVSQSFAQACGVNWDEKLSKYITGEYIASMDWYNKSKNWPRAVVLKPHRNGNNWVIHFQSADQERKRLQGSSVALAWIDEQVRYPIIMETWARLRDYNYPGSFFYTLTPLEPDPELEAIYAEQEKHKDWKFYRLDSRKNTAISAGFMERLVESEIEQRKETRLTGAFASFAGLIYPTFNNVHVVEPFEVPDHWWHIRGLDFGFNNATCCLWIAKDGTDRYYVYDEYFDSQRYLHEHAEEIKKRKWDLRSPYYGPTYADYGAAQERAEFTRMGIPSHPANKEVNIGIACIQKLLTPDKDGKPNLYIFKSCENLIREMRSYKWHPLMDRPIKENDHAVDAMRYGCFSDFKTNIPSWGALKINDRKRIA